MAYRQITSALLGLALVTFLTSGCVDRGQINQLESENAQLKQLILQKDASLKTLTEQAQAKQIELEAVKNALDIAKNELDIAKNELDSVKKGLAGVNQDINILTTTPVVPQQ